MSILTVSNQTHLLSKLLEKQQENINYFFENMRLEDLLKVLDSMLRCEGKIIFVGVGKSAIIAKKIASTFTSLGITSVFLAAEGALHGDIAQVEAYDLVILLSKGGETVELLRLLPYLKKRQVPTMAWVCKNKSKLAQMCDLSFHIPLLKELCPYNLAPTISACEQMMVGDLLGVALMQLKEFSIQDYAENHPSGYIGKRVSYTVEDIMVKRDELPVCVVDNLLKDCLYELSNKRCGALLVVNKQNFHLHGIFTDGDLRRSLERYEDAALLQPINKLMTKNPKYIHPQASLNEAIELMESDEQSVTVLPVIENESCVGLIKMHDIIKKDI